jgi:hypothetical protein
MYPCPRSFVFCAVPYYHEKPLLSVVDSEEHRFYCRWLVDYLDKFADKEVPTCQEKAYQEMEANSPMHAVLWLGEEAFYHCDCIAILERRIEDGLNYQEAAEMIRPWWEEANEGLDPDEVEPFEAWICPELWEEAKRELAEKAAMEFPATHADLGYRILLAKTLARESSADKRLELVNAFYEAFNEESAK